MGCRVLEVCEFDFCGLGFEAVWDLGALGCWASSFRV